MPNCENLPHIAIVVMSVAVYSMYLEQASIALHCENLPHIAIVVMSVALYYMYLEQASIALH